MKLVLVSLLFAFFGTALAQSGTCECGLFIIERVGAPVPHGPIYLYPSVPVDCSNTQDDVNCQFNCSVYFRETVEMDWNEEMPGEGISYGQYWCNLSFDFLEIGVEDPRDYRCLSTYADARYRRNECEGSDWAVAISEEKDFCCDQMGQYVPGCPSAGGTLC